MKPTKTPEKLALNASTLHKKIGELLVAAKIFRGYQIRQEYRVSLVNPGFKSNREKFDWCIPKLNVAIEVMGEQHFKPVCFGGISKEDAIENLAKQQKIDALKQQAAKDAGWAYVVITYEEKDITEEQLLDKIKTALAEVIVLNTIKKLANIAKKPIVNKKKIGNKINYKWPSAKIPSRPFGPKRGK